MKTYNWDGDKPDGYYLDRLRAIPSFFFFQAEDGIRDLYVTGVQTCALPISDGKGRIEIVRGIEVGHIFQLRTKYSEAMKATFLDETGGSRPFEMGCYGIGEIGRASCRERV